MANYKVSVVIPNYNGKEYLENCLLSLRNQDVRSFEVIVVDDASADDSIEKAKIRFPENQALPTFRYIQHNTNSGFCKTVNDGIKEAKAEYVILLNNDTVADTGFVGNMYDAIRKNDKVFSVSAKMVDLYNKEKLDDTGDLYCALGWAFAPAKDKSIKRYDKSCKVFSACGGAAIYRKSAFEKIGLFDENHFAYLEDVDIGYRAKLYGYINAYTPASVVYHAGSAVSGSRHNDFKVGLTVKNNLYLMYKNMPYWQLIVNLPAILVGIIVKAVFFTKKGLLGSYIKGLYNGLKLINSAEGKNHRVNFKDIPFTRQLLIEFELIFNCLRRLFG